MVKELDYKSGIAADFGNISALYIQAGQFQEGELYLDSASAIFNTIGELYFIMLTHQAFSELYDTTGRYQLALESYKKYTAAKDSIFNEDKSKDLGKLEAKHEFETAEMERKREEAARLAKEAAVQSRRDNLQYSGILIFLVLVFAGVFALGRFAIPIRVAEGLIFFSFLLFFEFTLVLLDPYIEQYSSGAPAIKLGFNALLAGLIFPLHSFFERKMKRRIMKTK